MNASMERLLQHEVPSVLKTIASDFALLWDPKRGGSTRSGYTPENNIEAVLLALEIHNDLYT